MSDPGTVASTPGSPPAVGVLDVEVTAEQRDEAKLRVMAARVIAQQRWPYVSALMFSLRLVPAPPELTTMAVDRGWRLYYSPAFVLNQTPESLATVLLHESMHCLHQHADRFDVLHQPPHQHVLWNIAGDAAINETLDEANMPWPSVEPIRYSSLDEYGVSSGMTTEGVFFALLDYQEKHGDGSVMGAADCGSVNGGGSRDYELPGGHDVHPAVRTDQQAVIRDRVAQDILVRSRHHGDVPAGLQRWAEDLLEPRIDWREALASRLRRDLAMIAGRRDYVYTRPSRRQDAMRIAGSTVLLPAMRQPAPPRVATVVDTSGSISDDELRDFAGELVGIARASGVASGVSVIPCDAQTYEVQRVRLRADVERLQLPGGGGTDMSAGIAAAQALSPPPHIVVVFTDGYTPWPDEQPREIDSMIVVLSVDGQAGAVPPWASLVLLNEE